MFLLKWKTKVAFASSLLKATLFPLNNIHLMKMFMSVCKPVLVSRTTECERSVHKQLVTMCQTFEHIVCLKLFLLFSLWTILALQRSWNTLSVFKGNFLFILHTWKPLLLTIQSSSTLGVGSNVEAANWPFGQLHTLCGPTKFDYLCNPCR